MNILPNSECSKSLGGYSLNSGQICIAGSTSYDTCSDPGAPLVCTAKSIRETTEWVLVGIDSKTLIQCVSGNPIIYTYINQYLGFLVGHYPTCMMHPKFYGSIEIFKEYKFAIYYCTSRILNLNLFENIL